MNAPIQYHVVKRSASVPDHGKDSVYLWVDHWNDYSFVTMFDTTLYDSKGNRHNLGQIKIGFKGQTEETTTYSKLPDTFSELDENYFSVGQATEFYSQIAKLPESYGRSLLVALRDIVVQPNIIDQIREERVFSASLLRGLTLTTIKGQFARVLDGKAELTNYTFSFKRPASETLAEIELEFEVEVGSKPSSNIHAIIGRNGVGKTTLLNNMIEAITKRESSETKFMDTSRIRRYEISEDYFSSLVSVSFSAFDPFTPPLEQPDPAKGTCYYYVGLKDPSRPGVHRTIPDLYKDCANALITCFSDKKKTERWNIAINRLRSDDIFDSMKLERLQHIYDSNRRAAYYQNNYDTEVFRDEYLDCIEDYLSLMSSGHAIVLLTTTQLVAKVEEKTLVLLDEPESHLHPPLLSAFVRALSELLHDRNGVGIIATHSPVILQEVARSCAWKIFRSGSQITQERPEIETFGENVGMLTSEVFGLEVKRAGFVELLGRSVSKGNSYEQIIEEYDNRIGFEGRALLKLLIAERESKDDQTE